MIYIIYKNKKQIVTPTIFPDSTSQIWKLMLDEYSYGSVKIVWNYEQEAELIWINQTIALLNTSGILIEELYIPYLPYARQDKEISNTTTFAKEIFLRMIFKDGVHKVTTLDAHSTNDAIESYAALPYIKKAILDNRPTILVFPDTGAYLRYANQLKSEEYSFLVLGKVRNQESGVITSLSIDENLTTAEVKIQLQSKHNRMLIVDDICDGGATFINASLYLHENYDCEVSLYVTHGIFSKGFDSLIKSGISQFYTTQSLRKNITGYVLEELINVI
jgi:ribose-phosphate pyrophosphokinase